MSEVLSREQMEEEFKRWQGSGFTKILRSHEALRAEVERLREQVAEEKRINEFDRVVPIQDLRDEVERLEVMRERWRPIVKASIEWHHDESDVNEGALYAEIDTFLEDNENEPLGPTIQLGPNVPKTSLLRPQTPEEQFADD